MENSVLVAYASKHGMTAEIAGKTGDTLRIDVVVTKDDIQRIGQGYWGLELGNFDRASKLTCKLKIEY